MTVETCDHAVWHTGNVGTHSKRAHDIHVAVLDFIIAKLAVELCDPMSLLCQGGPLCTPALQLDKQAQARSCKNVQMFPLQEELM